jgi:hypothetical protein
VLNEDGKGVAVKTLNTSIFPKGTTGILLACEFIPNTSTRVYLLQTENNIEGMVDGKKSAWYFERDLTNV